MKGNGRRSTPKTIPKEVDIPHLSPSHGNLYLAQLEDSCFSPATSKSLFATVINSHFLHLKAKLNVTDWPTAFILRYNKFCVPTLCDTELRYGPEASSGFIQFRYAICTAWRPDGIQASGSGVTCWHSRHVFICGSQENSSNATMLLVGVHRAFQAWCDNLKTRHQSRRNESKLARITRSVEKSIPDLIKIAWWRGGCELV